ncbi:MAG: ribosome small subunit-dependent GTPase A [Acidobacteriota bacterium]
MNHDERKLRKALQELEVGHELKKANRKTAKLRRAAGEREGEERFDARLALKSDPETLEDWAPGGRRARPRSLAVTVTQLPTVADAEDAAGRTGMVSAIAVGCCRVLVDGEEFDCRLAPAVALEQRTGLAVGDWVRLRERGGMHRVESVLPRRSRLARPDPHNPHLERVLAANVDLVLIATALRAPGVKPGLIDRVLLAASAAGVEGAVVVNKVDLSPDLAHDEELSTLEPLRAAGVRVLECSARTEQGLEALADLVAAQTAVLVGQSGCGKTSLLNALSPGLGRRVGAARESDGKGRHTTTSSSLQALAGGGFLIDTPGVRQFGLWQPSAEALAAAFPEIELASASCRFRDCRHGRGERGCAVVAAIECGAIPRSRLDSFLRLSSVLV